MRFAQSAYRSVPCCSGRGVGIRRAGSLLHVAEFPITARVKPLTNAITPSQAVIASSRRIEVASVRIPVLTRYFQLGMDHTQTRLHRSAKSKRTKATDRTDPLTDEKLGLDPNTVMTTKLPVTSEENHVWKALRSRSHSTTNGRFCSVMVDSSRRVDLAFIGFD